MQEARHNAIAIGLANCYVYEAFQKVAEKTNVSYIEAFKAFELLGRVKAILGERFEEVKSELYEKVKVEVLDNGYTEEEDILKIVAEIGIEIGEAHPLPSKIGLDPSNYVFFADIVMENIGYKIKYVRSILGKRLKVWNGRFWVKQPYEMRITLLTYFVLKQKIAIWREALKAGPQNADLEEWLGKLEKCINNPWWLEDVAEQLLRVDRFRGIVII
jgi:hypothetical protein